MRRIALDLDGCLYEWERTARYMLRNVYPNSPYKEVLLQESQGWDWIREQVSSEAWEWLWREGVALGLFRYGHVRAGAIQAVRELAKMGEIVIITHRPKQATTDTLAWLAYQQLPISGVHLLTNEELKSSVQPHSDAFLDDKPANIIDMKHNTQAATFLMRRPWNEGIVVPGDEVRTWTEFVEKVRAL